MADARRLRVTVPQAILIEQSTPRRPEAAKDIAAVLVVAGDAELAPVTLTVPPSWLTRQCDAVQKRAL